MSKIIRFFKVIASAVRDQYMYAPTAFRGKDWEKYLPFPAFAPLYEDNEHAVLNVCICNGCEKLKPRLEELAKDFRLSLKYQNENGEVKSISELFK